MGPGAGSVLQAGTTRCLGRHFPAELLTLYLSADSANLSNMPPGAENGAENGTALEEVLQPRRARVLTADGSNLSALQRERLSFQPTVPLVLRGGCGRVPGAQGLAARLGWEGASVVRPALGCYKQEGAVVLPASVPALPRPSFQGLPPPAAPVQLLAQLRSITHFPRPPACAPTQPPTSCAKGKCGSAWGSPARSAPSSRSCAPSRCGWCGSNRRSAGRRPAATARCG